jgi:heme oxygenase (mycobilin-producing)
MEVGKRAPGLACLRKWTQIDSAFITPVSMLNRRIEGQGSDLLEREENLPCFGTFSFHYRSKVCDNDATLNHTPTMAIKVILYRRVPAEKSNELKPLLLEMRSLALAQPGYISGETLMNADDPEEYIVISTWNTEENWNEWLKNDARMGIQDKIDQLLGRRTMYQVYYNA